MFRVDSAPLRNYASLNLAFQMILGHTFLEEVLEWVLPAQALGAIAQPLQRVHVNS